jgi:hypothetical protein
LCASVDHRVAELLENGDKWEMALAGELAPEIETG